MMITQHVLHYVRKASSTTRILVYGDPGHLWVITLILWLLRLFTFALLLRTYLIPWLLGVMTKRVRIRSISLRSVRGLYIRTGNIVLQAERISWKGIGILRASPITLKVEKLALEVGVQDAKIGSTVPQRSGKRLSLGLLSPSPIVRQFRNLIGGILSYLDPISRPILRQYAVAILRLGILWLPTYIPRLTFEFRDASVTFTAVPGSSVSVREITYSTSIQLIETEPSPDVTHDPTVDQKRLNSVTALKNRLADGFKRSLDRALGSTRGKGRMEFRVCHVQGFMPFETGGHKHRFLSLPDSIDIMACMDFNPRAWSIDTHTLEFCMRVGDISAKVDLINLIVDKLKPKVSPPKSKLPSQINVDTPRFSAFGFPSAGISASIQSALPSFASSFFSPTSGSGVKSPFSGSRLLSPASAIKSPNSPFFRAFSASMRPRRRTTMIQPVTRLLNTKKISTFAILCKAEIKVDSITLSASPRSPLGPYRGVVKGIHVSSGLAHDHHTPHHSNWLGKPKAALELYDADSYAFSLSTKKMQLERGTRHDSLPLIKVGEQTLHILAHQWPAPLLVVSPFISGDPNAPYIGVAYRITDVEATQRLDHLQELLKSIELVRQSSTRKPRGTMPTPSPLTLPRISITAEIGTVSAKLIFASATGHVLRALELATSGCSFAIHSEYQHATPEILRKYPTASSVVPIRLHSRVSLFVEPISILTRATTENDSSSACEDPSVLTIGSVELEAQVHGIAEADGPGEGDTVIDRESLACDCFSTVDAICVELWNPHVIDSVHQMLAILPVQKAPAPINQQPPEVKTSRFSKLPFGLTARGSLGQFVVFVTAPDINPNDSLDLSRGISLRFTPVLECRYLLPIHLHWFEHKDDPTHRLRLKLMDDTLYAEKYKIPAAQHDSAIFVRLHLLHATIRSLVATPFEPSEPLMVERMDAPQLAQDVFRVRHIQADLRISPNPPSADALHAEDVMEVKVSVPSVRGDIKLCHIYSALLAVQTVKSLGPPRSMTHATGVPVRSKFSFTLDIDVKAVQIYWTLPKRNVASRMDGFSTSLSSTGPPRVGFKHMSVFVPLPGRVNRWEGDQPGRWAEMLKLQDWQVFVSPLGDSASIAVQGATAHLVIPSGFMFFDLVFDTIIMVKALKHISHITKAGRFWKMPPPPAEGPKSIPLINVRLDFLCMELQDDPFEASLGLIWEAGFEAAKQRQDREEAFASKVAAIVLAEQQAGTLVGMEGDYQFSPTHTVGIEDARRRLDKVHTLDWKMRLEKLGTIHKKETDAILQDLFGNQVPQVDSREPDIVPLVHPSVQDTPLLRFSLHNLNMSVAPPSFPLSHLSDYLHKQGSGLPKDTEFSLLVPFHLHFSLSALRATLRDYPIPILDILPQPDGTSTVWTFDTDLVIAEEMGTEHSAMWFDCGIIDQTDALHGEALWSLKVPKTIMAVKTYANATIKVDSPHPTVFGWGISHGPAMQDVMRVVETLTSPPQDPSPVMGFWDKLRLILHWTFDIEFSGDVHVYLKGSRDPYETHEDGAGFVLGWQGNPRLRIGFENEQKELVQLTSDVMVIAVPDLDYVSPNGFAPHDARVMGIPKPFKKVWARLNTGTRFGVGFLPERACGVECRECSGPPSERQCRFFEFKPHWEVKLENKPSIPEVKTPSDSYNGFRSDFVHLSFSLESSLKRSPTRSAIERDYSSLHLTPKLFANFWAWCSLFNGAMGLPIRQGNYYPARPISPKLGKHIATLKYRLSIPHLYVMHGYIDDSRETWVDGITTWVGVKGMIDEFSVDMHQREEETQVPGPIPGTTRVLKRKPFYAAEVVLKGLDLRALLATFPDNLKKDVPIATPPQRSNYRKHEDLPTTSPTSPWHDPNDFVELDWRSRSIPALNLVPVATVPRFAYFKRISSSHTRGLTNKFGSEHSHICLLDKEPSVPRAQILLASARAAELRSLIRKAGQRSLSGFDMKTAEKMVALLEDYVTVLQDLDAGRESTTSDLTYFLPSEMASQSELAEFENVYQLHCPSIFLDSAIRDILLQYYYCSRARRGIEYHMATRAVKFIRDQANATIDLEGSDQKTKTDSVAELAATTLRKILKNTDSPKPSVEVRRAKLDHTKGKIEPLDGWAEGVSLSKSHCCLLLKPQIIMRGSDRKDTVIVAAGQAKLQVFNIMDSLHIDDPISGKVMSRNYMDLNGLQVYSPHNPLALGNSSIPLEVLIDLRCESTQFERLVPQTDATFHYDRFNRLRLRNMTTTTSAQISVDESDGAESHLRSQTDLMRVHIPRFTVSASSQHFQAISNVMAKLLLFSDPVHKTRLDRLETLIFAYDFRDLDSAANVICNLQERLRDAHSTRTLSARDPKRVEGEADRLSFLKLKAHIFLLEEELSLLFDAIKLAQDRFAASTEQNSALLLIASSSEISWRMLDDRTNLISKLVVQDINFNWLNRQDSSTVNQLTVGNLTAFDGSRTAMWAEIISKFDEPQNHPLVKKKLFCQANWSILAPVGGISIYESFELAFHPLRLQIDAKVGKRIMEYLWPARRERVGAVPAHAPALPAVPIVEVNTPLSPVRQSIDSPRGLQGFKPPEAPSLSAPRRLGMSRSFTDLRGAAEGFLSAPVFLKNNRSSDSLNPDRGQKSAASDASQPLDLQAEFADATVMKNRSSQKSFVFVRIASLNLCLSISKEGSFECRDARIKTRDLEYRNQTWSFEELVNQFIPSNMSWRGWVKMAFHQPLLPVLPVAKELISKTRWTTSKTSSVHESPLKLLHPRMLVADDDSRLEWLQNEGAKVEVGANAIAAPSSKIWKKSPQRSSLGKGGETGLQPITSKPISSEPEAIGAEVPTVTGQAPAPGPSAAPGKPRGGRKRVKSLFSRSKNSKSGDSVES